VKKAQAEADSIKLMVEQVQIQGGMEVLKYRLTQDYTNSLGSLAKNGNKIILP